MKSENPRVMIFTDWFEPGYKAGGPIRSCVNIARQLKDVRDIYIFTSDRDLGSAAAYPGIETDTWVEWEAGVKVFYASPVSANRKTISQQLKQINPAVVYLNSMFSVYYTLFPLLIKRFGSVKAKWILAPRGMLRSSALQFKKLKKKVFLSAFTMLGMHKGITFHATDSIEFADVKRQFGKNCAVVEVNDFPGLLKPQITPVAKQPGSAALIFIGRIHPVKNLHFLLEVLTDVKEKIFLAIAGVVEDENYWRKCEGLIKQLPQNVSVDFKGGLLNHELTPLIDASHLFVLPTQGENFGHAIFESIAAGRPVLISDQTPWQHLAASKAGWELPLNQPLQFRQVIEKVAGMQQQEFDEWCSGAWHFCKNYLEVSKIKEQYIKLFS